MRATIILCCRSTCASAFVARSIACWRDEGSSFVYQSKTSHGGETMDLDGTQSWTTPKTNGFDTLDKSLLRALVNCDDAAPTPPPAVAEGFSLPAEVTRAETPCCCCCCCCCCLTEMSSRFSASIRASSSLPLFKSKLSFSFMVFNSPSKIFTLLACPSLRNCAQVKWATCATTETATLAKDIAFIADSSSWSNAINKSHKRCRRPNKG